MVAKSVEQAIELVKKYLENKKDTKTLFINVNNANDYITIKDSLSNVLTTKGISDYCKGPDALPDLATLFYECRNTNDTILLLGFSQHLKIMGRRFFDTNFNTMLNLSTQSGKLVILCTQMAGIFNEMIKNDLRLKDRIILLDSTQLEFCKITFLNLGNNIKKTGNQFDGYAKYLKEFEENCICNAFVMSQVANKTFDDNMVEISIIDNPFITIQGSGIHEVHNLKFEYGNLEQWSYLLGLIDGKILSLSQLFEQHFGNTNRLEECFHKWKNWDENTHWLFYVALNIVGTQNNYLNLVLKKTQTYEEFIKEIYCLIFDYNYIDAGFNQKYTERKNIVKYLDSFDNISLFCKLSKIKGKDRLYYLTDLTDIEKHEIIECLSEYEEINESIEAALSVVYRDLAQYLQDYNFSNDSFEMYFKQYKRQKVNNKIYDGFIDIVNENARTREYNRILPTRNEIFEKIDKTNANIYFIDALGVEFLGYICGLCRELELGIKIYVAKANIPTTTFSNKDFLIGYTPIDIKDLDEIKHSGEKDYNYKVNRLPLHLPKELEIIREVFEKIKISLVHKSKAIVVSDHGASRLIVINEKQYSFDVESNGTQGGRCCKYNEHMPEIEYATIESGQYVLANYDRFKVQGAPRVETHGGATLEEVMVPIIEITPKNQSVVAKIIDKTILISYKKKAELKVFVSEQVQKVAVKINDKYYNSTESIEQTFVVPIHDIKKVGRYKAEIFVGDNFIKSDEFDIEKESMKTSDLGI